MKRIHPNVDEKMLHSINKRNCDEITNLILNDVNIYNSDSHNHHHQNNTQYNTPDAGIVRIRRPRPLSNNIIQSQNPLFDD